MKDWELLRASLTQASERLVAELQLGELLYTYAPSSAYQGSAGGSMYHAHRDGWCVLTTTDTTGRPVLRTEYPESVCAAIS